jgi:ketosteroid isomerase-like protein
MSQENVELVLGAFRTLDAEGLEAALAFFAPDCVWYTTDRWLEGSAYRGHEGMRHLNAAFTENFDDWGWNVRDTRDADDRVIALAEMMGQIKGSGAKVSQPLGLVVSDFHDGTFGEIRACASWREALEAVGLSE